MPRKRKWNDLVPPKDREANPLYITEHMNAQRISDAELGGRFGVSRQTVFRWRTEQRRLNIAELQAIAEVLKTDLAGLLEPPESQTPGPHKKQVSFDAAGRHITDPEARERIAKIIQDMRGGAS